MTSRTRWNIVLLLLVGGLVAINLTLRGEPTGRNIEIFPDMLDSVPYDSFTSNPNFEDGLTMRPLVEGTVLHGEEPLGYAKTPEDAVRAGLELVNPLKPESAVIERGQAVYRTFCEVCHGSGGRGDGPIAGRAGYPAPPSFLPAEARTRSMGDGQIFHIITYGGQNMPAYAAEIEREDRWEAVLWLRELQKKASAPNAEAAVPAGPSVASSGGVAMPRNEGVAR
ncbi:MAG: cytochrome c [Thermoanaerobaculia bacterium]|jgi:mono/diheme cytochrome c family protein